MKSRQNSWAFDMVGFWTAQILGGNGEKAGPGHVKTSRIFTNFREIAQIRGESMLHLPPGMKWIASWCAGQRSGGHVLPFRDHGAFQAVQ